MFIACLLIAAFAAAADQLIKLVVVEKIAMYQTIELVPNILSLTQIRNTGAAWSIMEGQTWFLIALPVLIVALALAYIFLNRKGKKLPLFSLALVMGGGIGNLIDRIKLGEVVDYIKLDFIGFPIFNFADMCVVVGAILFCVCLAVFDESKKVDRNKESENSDDKVTDTKAQAHELNDGGNSQDENDGRAEV